MSSQDFTRQLMDHVSDSRPVFSIWRLLRVDPPLLVALLLLGIFGLMVLYSATGEDFAQVQRQGFAILAAFCVMLVVAQFDVHFYRRWAPSMYTAGIAVLLLVLLVGVEENGAKSWLDLPGLPSFQPSELIKFTVPMLLAWYLGSRPLPPRFKHLFWAAVMILVPAGMIVVQNDTGTAIMIAMSGIFVVLLAGVPWRLVFSGGLVPVPGPGAPEKPHPDFL
jgi:rod shape determining protein RodA